MASIEAYEKQVEDIDAELLARVKASFYQEDAFNDSSSSDERTDEQSVSYQDEDRPYLPSDVRHDVMNQREIKRYLIQDGCGIHGLVK